jgi:hypothetical protein
MVAYTSPVAEPPLNGVTVYPADDDGKFAAILMVNDVSVFGFVALIVI